MRGLISAVTVAVMAATGGLLVVPPAAASACSPVSEVRRIPDIVIPQTGRAVVEVAVRVTQPCLVLSPSTYTNTELVVVNPGQDRVDIGLTRMSGDDRDGIWTGALDVSRTTNVGLWHADVVITTTSYSPTYSSTQVRNVDQDVFWVRRDTRVSESARSTSVRRGGTVRLSGHVALLTVKLNFVDWRHKSVGIYFQRAGHTHRTLVSRAHTDRRGRFRVTVTPNRTGRWFARVIGNTENTMRWSPGVRVRVRS